MITPVEIQLVEAAASGSDQTVPRHISGSGDYTFTWILDGGTPQLIRSS